MNHICLTCGNQIMPHPLSGWAGGNNPDPISESENLTERRVCDECNGLYVIPIRMGADLAVPLYDTEGNRTGTFFTHGVRPMTAVLG